MKTNKKHTTCEWFLRADKLYGNCKDTVSEHKGAVLRTIANDLQASLAAAPYDSLIVFYALNDMFDFKKGTWRETYETMADDCDLLNTRAQGMLRKALVVGGLPSRLGAPLEYDRVVERMSDIMAGFGWTVIYGELFFSGLTYNEGDAWHPSASDHNKAATSSFILQVKEMLVRGYVSREVKSALALFAAENSNQEVLRMLLPEGSRSEAVDDFLADGGVGSRC
jgi:hypothetical protein